MGRAKEDHINFLARVAHAEELCIEHGALERCELHPDVVVDTLSALDYEELTTQLVETYPESVQVFEDRADMVACVTEAMGAGTECGFCQNNANS